MTIPYGRHQIDRADLDAVVDVLENQFLTQGQQVPRFEQALKEYCGAAHTVAVNSGTSALHIACLALGLGPDDWLWTSPNSFVASANCGLYCGARVDFVDIDVKTGNLCLNALAEKLLQAARSNRLPKVMVVVHFAGLSCDMQAIQRLTEPYGIKLIEDASHALGGTYRDKPVGSCVYSDACVLSFHPVKSITTAEGGAVLTNAPEIARQLRQFASHGITRDPDHMEGESDGPWYYQQVTLGYNYRLSDLHAALGLSQLSRLNAFIESRSERAQRYTEALAGLSLRLPGTSSQAKSAWHLYSIGVEESLRSQIFASLQGKGIGANVHYIPIHLQPYYRRMGFKPGDFPNAETFYRQAITLPLFPGLTADEQTRVIQAVKESLN
ncbi:UDP-4-amino-4,6-dideoxy-N-acetyl-beta-L-altrosamine transaminase [Bowmanella dokdonensis]|uniref:UDP-4-amino-4, 6-dideoxy-N-acetyl-beta-L-altrosamine transaminase n=1 Tax=Bowmanella dokdonensis TaxID=751969 RepID=A0A939DP38_9ALTE|nr:UDP-4-amino-4,6-dideoxy-N-acetyl-beta-L-altrosamine transaminase [Bowmanella dokdonensis]MBN7826354.1 UDP-4-amino-4,6-dideoxy-N-acetyl-beta-L-altrosamine transaminase [Bowmanella dokdonensis]